MEKEFLGIFNGPYNNNCKDPTVYTRYKYTIDTITRWNDFGYYTITSVNLIKDDKLVSIGGIKLANFGQSVGEYPCVNPMNKTYYSFIANIESAVMLKLMVPKPDLEKLISTLGVLFKVDLVRNENAYKKAMLRDTTEEKFMAKQKQIKEIIYSDIDFHASLDFFKDSFKEYFK